MLIHWVLAISFKGLLEVRIGGRGICYQTK